MPLAFRKRLVKKLKAAAAPGDRAIKSLKKNKTVVLIEPDVSVRDALTLLLEGEDWSVVTLDDCGDLLPLIERKDVIAVISESSLPDCAPQEILQRCSQYSLPVIFTGHDLSLQGAVDLIRQGATDFLDKPFPQSRLLDLLEGLSKTQNSKKLNVL